MLIAVVIINIVIALTLLYVAWRLRRLQQQLSRVTQALVTAERATYTVLSKAPNFIYTGQRGISNLRLRNQVLDVQVQQLRQVLGLLFLGSRLWGKLGIRGEAKGVSQERKVQLHQSAERLRGNRK